MNSKYLAIAVVAAVLAGVAMLSWRSSAQSGAAGAELKVVDHVDLTRYVGKWYSVVEVPQFFSKVCAGGSSATYTALPNGEVEVYNACYKKDGSLNDIKGVAWVVDKTTNAKLKVSFTPKVRWSFLAGDYWVIDLGPNYEYAVVGHPSRRSGWILSRTPSLPEETINGIRKRLEAQGYDWSLFQPVNQKDYPPK
jgi:apolipoprotein D and lipocalin family protein